MVAKKPTGALLELRDLLRQLIVEADTNITQLAADIDRVRQQVSRAVNGREVPSKDLAEALDEELGGDGRIIALRERAHRERKARNIGAVLPTNDTNQPVTGPRTLPATTASETMVEEVSLTQRRDFLRLGAVAAPLASVLAMVQDASQAMAAAHVTADPLTIHTLEKTAVNVGDSYWSTPLTKLLPVVLDGYQQSETLLQGPRLLLKDRVTLTRLAGQYAYFAARIGYHSGSQDLSSFGVVASQYAADVNDPILSGSIACLRVSAAGAVGSHSQAVQISAEALSGAHPYFRPRLLASRALNLAMLGRETEARDALTAMEQSPTALAPAPGIILWDEGQQLTFAALALATLGDPQATPRADAALAGLPVASYEARANAHFARAHVAISHDPEAAAHEGLTALEINRAWPAKSVHARLEKLHDALSAHHRGAAGVDELGARLSEI
ncbi:hypothetical protein [Frankia gtarii]|uniref:hypothetical protein n=1 Tax=Frankia gtarii TaxID=2950102 RepID=UPI0021BE8868|nr:hypothetical protein [Frankia gtarii]